MDVFIAFFRDVLDGPIYITSTVISVILICAGIGYFAEKKQNREQEEKKFNDTHVKIENTHVNETNNISTGAQKTTISNSNTNSNQYNVSDNITRTKIESRVVPEVLAPEKPTPNVQPTTPNNYNQNMVYQNNIQTQTNNINYNNQNNMETSNYYNRNVSNQQNTNYNNQNQIYNNTNINNNFTN